MELKASPVKSRGLSPDDYATDPDDDDKDLSDDDRNHKHRRRAGTRSQSPESAAAAPGPPYVRRNNKPFENGRRFREGKFQKRPPGPGGLSRRPVNVNSFAGRGLGTGVPGPPVGYGGFGAVPMGFRGVGGVVGVGRRRCRDFEEQGFCLRGDMCPMEHGVNRIVVEDVQSLSQFNLPVLLPSGQLLGTPVSSQVLPSLPPQSHSAMLMSRGAHRQTSMLGIHDSSLGINDVYPGSVAAGGADVYDPDEPLWNNDGLDKSNSLSALHSLKNGETELCTNFGPSDRHHTSLDDGTDNELRNRSSSVAVGSQNTTPSARGRMKGSKDRLDVKEKSILRISTSGVSEFENNEDGNAQAGVHSGHPGKRVAIVDSGPKAVNSSFIQNDKTRNVRGTQKALRTLFVNGIPQKSNMREALLVHFQKFGQVIDIHIPNKGEKAFVQFSKREEAEAALKAPDAVMGNRFIKLWWANRDNVIDDNISSSGSVSSAPALGAATSAQLHTLSASKAIDNFHSSAPKTAIVHNTNAPLLPIDYFKPANSNGPITPPSSQKKLELEQLKEELRKKQVLLEQKRNDFKRQLHKFEKQAGGNNGSEIVVEPSPKRQKTGVAADSGSAATPSPRDPDASVASQHADIFGDRNKSAANVASPNLKFNTAAMQPEPTSTKQPIRPSPSPRGLSVNRYKLDNRSTTFRISPPLPDGLANVDALKDHFSSFGELSSLELEDDEPYDTDCSKELRNCSVRVSFKTRYSAEKAYASGKHWKGNMMQFVWIASCNNPRGKESSLPASTCATSADAQPIENLVPSNSSEASASKDGDQENTESVILKSIEADVISQFKPCLNGSSS